MKQITIEGGRPLRGEIAVQSAKNSVLPILAATLLCADTCRIRCCPHLDDVDAAAEILRHLGCTAVWEGCDLLVDAGRVTRCDIPDRLMRAMRSSVIFLGALLARCAQAKLSYPGGCELGPRPIDLHLKALRALGAQISECGGSLYCRAPRLHGTEIVLSLPSVGATENAMLAACGAEGTTVIIGAAREPEIADLQDFLMKLGAEVHGAGGSTIAVTPRRALHGCEHRCIGDRIAAATYLSAAAAAGGQIALLGADPGHLSAVTDVLRQAGCAIRTEPGFISLRSDGHLRAVTPVRTAPYPGFPTDAQAVVMAALLRSAGSTVFVENIFENRYRHAAELRRMGADIRTEGRVAVVYGVPALQGAAVEASDLRGGAALVVAGLQAEGKTHIRSIHHIQRGYADIVSDLTLLGGSLTTEEVQEATGKELSWQDAANTTEEDAPAGSPLSTGC